SDECIEVALGEPALGDLCHPRQNLGLRGAIEIGLDDEPSAAHVYLHRDADMKPGALEPSALQVQLGSRHRAPVRAPDFAQSSAHGVSPDFRGLSGFLSGIARNAVLC